MKNKVNYQKEMEKIIGRLESRPTLFLHSCCAPCSSYCMEYTREYFDVTVFYYNPNISSDEEYRKRLEEEKRLIAAFNKQVETGNFVMNSSSHATKIHIVEGDYRPQDFYNIGKVASETILKILDNSRVSHDSVKSPVELLQGDTTSRK